MVREVGLGDHVQGGDEHEVLAGNLSLCLVVSADMINDKAKF